MDVVTSSDGSLQKEFLLSDHKIHQFSFFVPNNNMRLIGHFKGGKKNIWTKKEFFFISIINKYNGHPELQNNFSLLFIFIDIYKFNKI